MRIVLAFIFLFSINQYVLAAEKKHENHDDFDDYAIKTQIIDDPFEQLNRAMYKFNEGFDHILLEPVSQIYKKVLPDFAKKRVDDFFVNINEPVSMLNYLFQGNIDSFLRSFSRFLVNSTLGLFGIMDIASLNHIKKSQIGFADTMANYCIPSGSYVVLPILGPSSTRDILGLVIDSITDPFHYLNRDAMLSGMAVQIVHNRNKYSKYIQDVNKLSFDKYTMVKSTYSQRQRKLKNCKQGAM